LKAVVEAGAAGAEGGGGEDAEGLSEASRREEGVAAAEELGDHVDLDLVEGAAFYEGHLQLAAAEHPDITVGVAAEFGDEAVDVAAGFERADGIGQGAGGDDDGALLGIGP